MVREFKGGSGERVWVLGVVCQTARGYSHRCKPNGGGDKRGEERNGLNVGFEEGVKHYRWQWRTLNGSRAWSGIAADDVDDDDAPLFSSASSVDTKPSELLTLLGSFFSSIYKFPFSFPFLFFYFIFGSTCFLTLCSPFFLPLFSYIISSALSPPSLPPSFCRLNALRILINFFFTPLFHSIYQIEHIIASPHAINHFRVHTYRISLILSSHVGKLFPFAKVCSLISWKFIQLGIHLRYIEKEIKKKEKKKKKREGYPISTLFEFFFKDLLFSTSFLLVSRNFFFWNFFFWERETF